MLYWELKVTFAHDFIKNVWAQISILELLYIKNISILKWTLRLEKKTNILVLFFLKFKIPIRFYSKNEEEKKNELIKERIHWNCTDCEKNILRLYCISIFNLSTQIFFHRTFFSRVFVCTFIVFSQFYFVVSKVSYYFILFYNHHHSMMYVSPIQTVFQYPLLHCTTKGKKNSHCL